MKIKNRNVLCACGSGVKTKHCLPQHPPTMDELHEQALQEDYERWKRSPAERARGRRALQSLALISAAVGVPFP